MNEEINEYFAYLKEGKLEYFDAFYELAKKKVFYNIFSLTKNYELSEDLLQDTFVKFLQKISEIDSNESILGYLMLLSRNITLDYFKKHNRVREIDEVNDVHIMQSLDEKNIDEHLLIKKIKGVLKDKEFEIFILHVLSEMTFQEIAKLKKRPVGTILWSYNNSIKKLQKEVKLHEAS